MRDLNKTLFFRTQFELHDERPDSDILWQVVLKIRKWMGDKWEKRGVDIPMDMGVWSNFKFGGHLTSTDEEETVSFKSTLYVPAAYETDGPYDFREATNFEWACTITEIFEVEGCAPRDWISEISYVQSEQSTGTLAVIISYADRAGYLGPIQNAPYFSVPKIVRWFLGDKFLTCSVKGLPATMVPYEVSTENIAEFWAMVSDPDRELPVVYLSPRINDEGEIVTLVEPRDLTWVLGPNAIVAYATDTAVSRAMYDVIQNDKLRCTGGAVRIYAERPRFDDPADSYRHRFFSARKVEELGAQTIIGYLGRALSQDVHYYHDLLRKENVDAHVRRAKLMKEARLKRLEHVAQVREQAEEQVSQVRELAKERIEQAREEAEEQSLEDMISMEEKLQAAQDEADIYAAEVDELSEQLFNANAQLDGLKAALASSSTSAPAVKLESWPPSPEAIVGLFLAAYPDRFDLTEAAWDTLKDCTTNADILWNALNDLVTIAWPLYEDGSGDIEKAFCNQSRFELAKTEGKMTKADSKLVASYDDVYNGVTYSCMAHIINGVKESDGKFIRIYFCFARQEGKIIVSHIGKHKTNYTTGRR